MTLLPDSLHRLRDDIQPSQHFRESAKHRLMQRITAASLVAAASTIQTGSVHTRLRKRILSLIRSRAAEHLQSIAQGVTVDASVWQRLRTSLLLRLQPVRRPLFGSMIKWSASFAAFLLILRATPLLFLSPVTAISGVQAVPHGTLSMLVGGIWQDIQAPVQLRSAVVLRTTENEATLIFGNDGVVRMAPETTLKVFDVTGMSGAPLTLELLRGRVWALGLTAPFADGITVKVGTAIVGVNAGSVDMEMRDPTAMITAYDRGATVKAEDGTETILVTGERMEVRGGEWTAPFVARKNVSSWVTENLRLDAVHRDDIARLIASQRETILPTSVLYPAKRLAEEVDVLFTLSSEMRTQKRIQQAGTRLREAVALLAQGEEEQATGPLRAYADTLVAMAGDQKDNLVKDIIRNQIAEASASLDDQHGATTAASLELLKEAVASVATVVPSDALSPRDVEGYVLVDTLAKIQHDLASAENAADAARLYADVQPYLANLLVDEQGMHPLLKREAASLLASIASLARSAPATDEKTAPLLLAIADSAASFLPEEPAETASLLITEEELLARIQEIRGRIFLFRAPQSRYNQLLVEIEALRTDPNRGRLLRRLKQALPYTMSQELVAEIQSLREITD